MQKRRMGMLVGAIGLLVATAAWQYGYGAGDKKVKQKVVVVLQAGRESHEGMARALHALLYAAELKEHGHDVVLLFDGAGTEWAEAMRTSEKKNMAQLYKRLDDLGVVEIVCDFCAGAFKVKESLVKESVPLTAEYQGHPSLAKYVDQGYQVIVL